MRRRIFALCAVLAVPVTVIAQQYYNGETITVADTAIGLTKATIRQGNGHPQANKAICRLATAQIRFWANGQTPTASVGMILEVGDIWTSTDPNELEQFSAIRTGSTSGVLTCEYRN